MYFTSYFSDFSLSQALEPYDLTSANFLPLVRQKYSQLHKKTPFILFKFYLFYIIFTNFVTHKKLSDIRYKSTYCVASDNELHVLLYIINSNTICRPIYRISEGFFFVCYNLCENEVKYVTLFLCKSHFMWVYRANNMVNIVLFVFISSKLHILTGDSWCDRCWLNIDFQILFEWLSNA